METLNEQGVKNLVFAIIARAIIDYEKARLNGELTSGIGRYTHRLAIFRVKKKKKFFESDFCYLMTEIDGDQIIYACKQRVKKPNYNPDSRFHPHTNNKNL